MKNLKALKILLLTLIMAIAVSGTALAGSQDFTVINGTGKAEVLYPGQDLFIRFSPRDGVQFWDLKVVYETGGEDYWYNLDLFSVYSVTIRPGGTASIEAA